MDRSDLPVSMLSAEGLPVAWCTSPAPVDYPRALAFMDERAAAIRAGQAPECVWLLEHPPLYTAGTSASDSDLRAPTFPVYRTGRGGRHTYHGPGQRIAYVMLDLKRRRPDVRAFVAALEAWIIATLAELGVAGERREDRVGVWVRRPGEPGTIDREDKIAALGIRLRQWVSLHGISLNVAPDLRHFQGIVPCGIGDERFGVTSLADLGRPAPMNVVDAALRRRFERFFGATADAPSPELA